MRLTSSVGTEVSCLYELGQKATFIGVVPDGSVGRAFGFSAGDLVPKQKVRGSSPVGSSVAFIFEFG